jgi:hypothetical protein
MKGTLNQQWLLTAAVLASLTGCGPKPEDKIVGNWEGRIAGELIEKAVKMAEKELGKSASAPNLDAGRETRKTLAGTRLERNYLPGGSVVMSTVGDKVTGTWSHLEGDDYRLVWSGKTPLRVTVRFDGPDSFTEFDVEGNPSLQFQRVSSPQNEH